MRRLNAKFPGRCRNCKKPISPGQPIYWTGSKFTFHVGCEPSQPRGATAREPVREPVPRERGYWPTREAQIIDCGWQGYASEEGHYDDGGDC